MKYPAIEPASYSGAESITNASGDIIAKLTDFWSWAHSNLMDNTERGILAEYLVACAVDIQSEKRVPWSKYDLLTKEGIKIEVKSSGYLQTWGQEKLSNIAFGIQETYGWNEADGTFDDDRKRQSDIYVFCVHKHANQETVNPLDVTQWDFYLLSTQKLNENVNHQKSITLSSLLKIGAEKCTYELLYKKILKIIYT